MCEGIRLIYDESQDLWRLNKINFNAMPTTYKRTSTNGMIILFLALMSAIALEAGYTDDQKWYTILIVTVPLIVLIVVNGLMKHNSDYSDEQNPDRSQSSTPNDQKMKTWKKEISSFS